MHSNLFTKYFAIVAVILAGLTLVPSRLSAQGVTPPSNAPYLNPALPIEQRVDDLISRMTLEEKASQLVNQARAIPRLQVPAYDWWSESLHGVAAEWHDRVSRADWPGRHLRRAGDPHDGRGDQHRGAHQACTGGPRGPQQHLRGPGLLGAEHQHLPRSALGPRPGDVWRRPVPDRRAWAWPSSPACRATIRTTTA